MIQISMGLVKKGSDKLLMYQDRVEDFELTLSNSKLYDVGIDQSHTCTGICIRPLDKSFLVVIEVLNVNTDNQIYRLQLRDFLERILKDYRIRYFVMEEPLSYLSGRRNAKLAELKQFLMKLKDKLNVEVFTTENVTSWRHGLMPKKCDGDRRKKETVVKAVLEIYPTLEEFLGVSNIDTDGIEAVGILLGYIARHGIEDGAIKIIGPINTVKKSLCAFKYVDISDKDLLEILKYELFVTDNLAIGKGGCKLKSYNTEHNLHANAKMSLVDNFTKTIVTDDLDIISVLIRMKQVPKPNHMMIMVSMNERYVNSESTLIELFQDGFYLISFQ